MIPIYRCRDMEAAANLLAAHYQHVLVYAAYDNYTRIRFRPDRLRDPRVYFNKVPSQHRAWRKTGGVLVTWKNNNLEGPRDATLMAECPKSMEGVHAAMRDTISVAVIYMPPTWRPHEEQIARRHAEKHPAKYARQMRRLAIVRDFVERLPWFTAQTLARLLARREGSRPSSAPALSESAEPAAGIRR